MAKIVYPVEVFDKSENGTVFYKDGIINDDLRQLGPGILESWRYDFNAGKQIFRATGDDKGPIYERRLVKDLNGNPRWTGWMEIPEAEVKGIQAIAVNNGPLKLPNSEGAIKLEITPQLLKVFTKNEVVDLIDQKITDYEQNRTDYIPWPIDENGQPFDLEPKEVLKQHHKGGGFEGTLYIVAKSPNAKPSDYPTQWIWNVASNDGKGNNIYDWIQVGGEAGNAWVTYADFDGHRGDERIHLTEEEKNDVMSLTPRIDDIEDDIEEIKENYALQEDFENHISEELSGETLDEEGEPVPNTIHINEGERDKWNKKLDAEPFIEHRDDDQSHITQIERQEWNSKLDAMPYGEKRFVGAQGEWKEAFEQVQHGEEDLWRTTYTASNEQFRQQITKLVYNFKQDFNTIIKQEQGTVIDVVLEFTSCDSRNIDFSFHTEDPKRRSPIFNSARTNEIYSWSMGAKTFESIYVEYADSWPSTATRLPSITGLAIKIKYKKSEMIQIGGKVDPTADELLQVNIIGPEDKPLLYNGNQISGDKTIKWGNITDDINNQEDIVHLITNTVGDRLHGSPATLDRWEVTNVDTWVKSHAQSLGENISEYKSQTTKVDAIVNHDNEIPSIRSLIDNFFASIPYGSETIVAIKMKVAAMTSAETSDGMYFVTDDPAYGRSPSFHGFRQGWEWSLPVVFENGAFKPFHTIICKNLTNQSGSALRQANHISFEVVTATYDGVVVSTEGKNRLIAYGQNVQIGDANAKTMKVHGEDVKIGNTNGTVNSEVFGANIKVGYDNATTGTYRGATTELGNIDAIQSTIHGKKVNLGDTTSTMDDITLRGIALSDYFHEKQETQPWAWPKA